MAKIIFTSRYHKNIVSKRGNLLSYMGTREGVEKMQGVPSRDKPPTKEQESLIESLIKKCPEAKSYAEYEAYMSSLSRATASEFISEFIERNADHLTDFKRLVSYMANRPGAEKIGAHGLFSQFDEDIDLKKCAEEVDNHKGIVWTHVISLKREDAERLGYNNAEVWKSLIRRHINEIAWAHRIDVDNLQWYYLNGKMQTSEPKTKTSIRTIKLPEAVLNVLKKLKEITDSRWMFPSPKVDDVPRTPNTLQKNIRKVLERADCKRIRFHDLRHTFATTALANGMDIKTLSSIIGHVSSSTTLDIYLHSTDKMQKEAARSIDRGIRGVSKDSEKHEELNTDSEKTAPKQKFEPTKSKHRKPGTGCITMINDHLWEGRYSPKVNGKKMVRNIYAHTKEECEEKLTELIKTMKAEIAELKKNG